MLIWSYFFHHSYCSTICVDNSSIRAWQVFPATSVSSLTCGALLPCVREYLTLTSSLALLCGNSVKPRTKACSSPEDYTFAPLTAVPVWNFSETNPLCWRACGLHTCKVLVWSYNFLGLWFFLLLLDTKVNFASHFLQVIHLTLLVAHPHVMVPSSGEGGAPLGKKLFPVRCQPLTQAPNCAVQCNSHWRHVTFQHLTWLLSQGN